MSNLSFVRDTLEKYGLSDRFDAKKVLRKIGGKRPGKRCKGGWIAADKQCSDHKTADGKLTAAGKSSASELADKVRKRKGMESKTAIAQGKLIAAKDKSDGEYWKFYRSQRQNIGAGAMAQANMELGEVEKKAGQARIWNRPFSEQSMQIFGYGSQNVHRKQVEKAIKMGETIPKDVLDQYPEFAGMTKDKPEPKGKKSANYLKGVVKEIADYEKTTRSDSEDHFDSIIDRLNDRYGLRLDAKKVLRKIGGRRPGKHCVGKAGGKGSYISAEKQCKGHKGSDGKLTAASKYSASELAARVRDRKGMPEKYMVKYARRSLAENLAPLKGAATEAYFTPQIKSEHAKARSELNRRRAKAGLPGLVDKNDLKKQLVGLDDRIESEQKARTARKTATTKAKKQTTTELTLDVNQQFAQLSPVERANRWNGAKHWWATMTPDDRKGTLKSIGEKPRRAAKWAGGGMSHESDNLTELGGAVGDRVEREYARRFEKGLAPHPSSAPGFIGAQQVAESNSTRSKAEAKAKQRSNRREASQSPISEKPYQDDRTPKQKKEQKAAASGLAEHLKAEGYSSSEVDKVRNSDTSGRFPRDPKTGGSVKFVAPGIQRSIDKYQAQIAPSDLRADDRRQAVQFNEQGAQRAKAEGRSADAKAWEQQAKVARISEVKSRQRQVNTSQGEMFGIEETTDLPLFRKRKDSKLIRWDSAMDRIGIKYGLRFDRAITGGKASPKSGKKKNCSDRSHQCGSVCVPLKNKCRKGDLSKAQERLKKLRKSGADDLLVRKAKNSLVERTGDKRKTIDENRVSGLRNRLKNSILSSVGKSEGLGEIDPYSIKVDPKRFQYKIIGEHTATGSVGSLAGVKRYDPNLAGILQVWRDPADGEINVVNGHNRLELGKKLNAESVAVRYLKAPDAKTARSIGALTNIAEGRGDALDAAKFFRDTGISKEDLSAKGIPMREKIATDGLALSKLDDSLFRRTIDGDIPMARAAIVGGPGLDAAQQRDLMKLVDKEGKKKNLTDAAIVEMVDIAKSSQTFQESTMSLFGEESVTKSNMIEKAKLQASIKQRLSREKNLFGTVSRGRAADELARGGNTIDKSKSGEISAAADQSLKVFDQMKNLSGPVFTAINKAASRMAAGESQKSVEKDLYAEISSIDALSLSKRRAA